MSTSPPPPPPPNPQSYATGSAMGWDRRTLREQRRLSAQLVKQQRYRLRQQIRASSRRSTLVPLTLVALGVLFLLVEMGNLSADAVLLWLSSWWPTLLLGAGLILLGEWVADTWVGAHRQAALPRRTLGPGGVFLLVLVTIVGLIAMTARNHADWSQQNWASSLDDSWGLEQMFAHHSDTDQELTASLAPAGLLTIENFRGNVNVSGASLDGRVHVSVHQQLVGWRREDVRARKERDRPQLQTNASGLLLRIAGEGSDRADLTVELPHDSGLQLAPERGEITVSELRGPLTVSEHTGNIALTGLSGRVHIIMRDDSATVTGHSLSGDLALEGRTGDLSFSDVTGPLTLHGDFFGSTHLERIQGPVHFQSSFTDFSCTGIPGELNIEGRSELRAHGLDGPVLLSTTDRNLTLTNVRRGAIVNNQNGSVTLGISQPLGPVNVKTTDGSIHLSVPERSAFSVKAETIDGQVENDFGLNAEKHESQTSLRGQVAVAGPALSLQTREGDIIIRKESETHADGDEQSEEPAASTSEADALGGRDHSGSRRHIRRIGRFE